MQDIIRVGVDLAKNVIQVHAVNAAGLQGCASPAVHWREITFDMRGGARLAG
jgi:hypothetical protein